VLTDLQGRASDVLHRIPKEETYEIIEALEDRFGDQPLAAAYRIQLKTRKQRAGEALQEIATAVKQLTTAPRWGV
jgi:hypothetical protein